MIHYKPLKELIKTIPREVLMNRHIIGFLSLLGTLIASSQHIALPTDGTLPSKEILVLANPLLHKKLEDKKQFMLSTNATPAWTFTKEDSFFQDALEKHKNLASYKVFDRSHNGPKKRREFTEQVMNGKHFDVTTKDGETISCTFIDNKSDTLLVIGHGFTDPREVSAPIGALFGLPATENLASPAYDILLIQLRGHGIDQKPYEKSMNPRKNIRNQLLSVGVDIDKIKLGTCEHLDVKAAVEKAHTLTTNRHTRTFGYAMCYSTMAFVKAEVLFPGTFNKLVLDSVWISIKDLVDSVGKEPDFITKPQRGGGKFLPGIITGTSWFTWMLRKTFSYLSTIDIDKSEEMTPYLEKLTIPVFFIHAIFDRFTTYANMLQLVKAKKQGSYALLLTPHQHIISHLKSKEIIRELCWQFFEDDHNITSLKNLVTKKTSLLS